ncbi:sensor histidine kinase [Candidatus Soleaferrea massiliensis]|uniref:sensor histidine kinase n=1 Tax=Candidatus Soleaferrea massiliensis TaxID=1470354 RepID=UPI00058BA412|nr:GHKL domain-containing protein [Candidatus Soleaferrea massiliensis]
MLDLIFNIGLILISGVLLILQYSVALQIFGVTVRRYKLLLSCLPPLIVDMIAYFCPSFSGTQKFGIWIILTYLTLLVWFRIRPIRSGLILGTIMVLSGAVECFYSIILSICVPDMRTHVLIQNSILFYIIVRLISCLLWTAFYLLVKKWEPIIRNMENSKHIVQIILVNVVFLIMLLAPSMLFFEQVESDFMQYVKLYYLLLLMLMFCYGVYNVIKTNLYLQQEQKLESQKLYIETLESANDKLRGFKHDLSNIISSINGFIHTGRYDLLEQYMIEMDNSFTPINNAGVTNEKLKDIPLLYGVLLAKISQAEIHNVKLTVTVLKNDFDLSKMRLHDLSRVVGILLDNALEAAAESKDRLVDFIIADEKTFTALRIINTCDKPVDIESIFEKGVTSKEEHSGFGLYEVRRIIDRYNSVKQNVVLYTDYSSGLFEQKILL